MRKHLTSWFQIVMDAGSSLDNAIFQADSLVMFYKGLALLLVLSWVILFETVIIENLDGFGSHFHCSAHGRTWSAKPAVSLSDDTVESAGDAQLSQCQRFEAPTAELPVIGPTNFQRCLKLHTLHHVFLI
jgi:hypothetical protein